MTDERLGLERRGSVVGRWMKDRVGVARDGVLRDRFQVAAALLFVLVMGFAYLRSEYLSYVAALVVLWAVLTSTMNLGLGLVGLLSLAQLAFYGLGAYGTVILVQRAEVPFMLALGISVVLAVVVATLFGMLAIRFTKGLMFALATFALSEVIRLIGTTWYDVTGGPTGIVVTFSPSVLGIEWVSSRGYLICFAVILGAVMLGYGALLRRPLGMRLLAVREDPYLAEAVGVHVYAHQVAVFAVGAAIAALAGGFVAPFNGVITPELMAVTALIPLLGMVVVGGVGTVWGPLVGAAVFTLPPIFFNQWGHLINILLGVVVVAVAMYLPAGVLGHRRPELRLSPDKLVAGSTHG